MVLLSGVMATNILGKKLLERVEQWVLRIPIVASAYAGTKQMIDSFKMVSLPASSTILILMPT